MGSMPGLIFLPAVTLGGIPSEALGRGMTGRRARMLDEALPQTASRQWWGALVTPASFHELWLVRGLADFSAALYNEAAGDAIDVRQHWISSQDALQRQDGLGLKLSDAPPIWWGPMTDIHSTRDGSLYQFTSNQLLARKGGFIIHMLRQLMRDPASGDRDFIAMMHDFTATYANRSASTEDFRAIVEKHRKPSMVLDTAGNMQWFFDQWVYGNEIPSYRLDYVVTPAAEGKATLSGVLTQSGVSDSFRMRAWVYAKLAKMTVPVASVAIAAGHSVRFEATLPEAPKDVLLNADNDVLVEHQEVRRVKTLPPQ
jgi:aminopeptidase N